MPHNDAETLVQAPTSFEVQIEALGGEPLAGSGFEEEEPEPGFSPARQNLNQG